MNQEELVKSLSCPLPDDIRRLKDAGWLSEAQCVISARLREDLPTKLRARLICEQERLRRLPLQYPFDRAQALEQMRTLVPDFTEKDLQQYEDKGLVDWIYLDGQKRYFVRFHRSLAKYCLPLSKENPYLDGMIEKMKQNGQLSLKITLETSISPAKEAFVPGIYRAWLPVPVECDQQSGLTILQGSPDLVGDSTAVCRSAYWERELTDNTPFTIRYSYFNRIHYINPLEERPKAAPLYPEAAAPGEQDLKEDGVYIRFTPYLKELAKEITQGCKTQIEKAWSIYCFCTKEVKYTFMRQYFQIDNLGEYCAVNLRGDCGLQALAFINLCRIAGIPARWQSGLYIGENDVGCHDWAQFYSEPFGWLFADPSFGGSAFRSGNMTRHLFYFGNIDPARMAACRCFMAPLDPVNQLLRNDPYDLQTGEIERVNAQQPLLGAQIDTAQRLIDRCEADL